MDLGAKILLPILFVVGVMFLVVGVSELYSALTGSGSDGDLFFSWVLPSLSALIRAFLIIIPGAIAWGEFAKRRFLAAEPVTPDTPLHDAEEWWNPKMRLKREEVDLVIERLCGRDPSIADRARGVRDGGRAHGTGWYFHLGRRYFGVVRPFIGGKRTNGFPDSCPRPILLHHPPRNFPLRVLSGLQDADHPSGQVGARKPEWRHGNPLRGLEGLVDIVHLETAEITAIHQTTHPSWAGPPTDAYIIAGWKILRAPLHDDASRLCEVLGIKLDRTAPNLADLYVKQGDMSGNRPMEVSVDAEFEGYRDRQRPFGMWFLSVFVWAFPFLSLCVYGVQRLQ